MREHRQVHTELHADFVVMCKAAVMVLLMHQACHHGALQHDSGENGCRCGECLRKYRPSSVMDHPMISSARAAGLELAWDQSTATSSLTGPGCLFQDQERAMANLNHGSCLSEGSLCLGA